MVDLFSALRRHLLPAHFCPESSGCGGDHPAEPFFIAFLPLVTTYRRLRLISEEHPAHFGDLRRQLDVIGGKIDAANRKPPGPRRTATTIAELKKQLELLSKQYDDRLARVEKWASTAKAFRPPGDPFLSPARPLDAPSR